MYIIIFILKAIHYHWPTSLKTLERKFLKIFELDPANSLSDPGLAWQAALKKTKVELELLTDIDMLLMVERGNI